MHKHFLGLIILLVALFFVNMAVLAWQEPVQPPPQGNVSTPLNVGNVGQSKIGGLILNTGGAQVGLLIQQGNVGIGTTNPASSALLDLTSQGKGLLLPRMSTAQRNAIANPVAGLQVFNTTDREINYFDGNEWKSFIGGDIDPEGLDCFNAGGSWHTGQSRCYFYSSSCPAGWSTDPNWSSTLSTTCATTPPGHCFHGSSTGGSCTTGSHTRANRLPETCTYTYIENCNRGCSCGRTQTGSCTATTAETACVKN